MTDPKIPADVPEEAKTTVIATDPATGKTETNIIYDGNESRTTHATVSMPRIGANETLILRTDGRTELHDHREYRRLLDFDTFDFVSIGRAYGNDLIMVLNDLGYEYTQVEVSPGVWKTNLGRAKFPVNEQATKLYWQICRPGTTHQIVGDVAILHDDPLSQFPTS